MTRVVVTRQARHDVRQILSELHHRAGMRIAERYADSFKSIFASIREFPGIGPPRPKLGRDTRIRLLHPYIVIYDYAEDTATILRVLHGRRKITGDLVR